jgi:hypothetical protein
MTQLNVGQTLQFRRLIAIALNVSYTEAAELLDEVYLIVSNDKNGNLVIEIGD